MVTSKKKHFFMSGFYVSLKPELNDNRFVLKFNVFNTSMALSTFVKVLARRLFVWLANNQSVSGSDAEG